MLFCLKNGKKWLYKNLKYDWKWAGSNVIKINGNIML